MYQKAMPAGSAGIMTPSYGMEAILKPVISTPVEEPIVEPQDPIEINSWILVDHTNFEQARHNLLTDYYNNYPTEAAQDGESWPPFTPSKFPWLAVNYNFDGETELIVKYQGNVVFNDFKPSAKIINELNVLVDRTYAILSVPETLGLTQFTETVSGTAAIINPDDIKVFVLK